MQNLNFTLAYGVMLLLGMAGSGVAQDNGVQQPQHVSSFSICMRRNRSTRNSLVLRKICS